MITTLPLTAVGILMPHDCPQVQYDAVHRHCPPKMNPEPPLGAKGDEYSFAWNAVADRCRAVAEHDEAFVTALSRDSPEDRSVQDRESFGFFVSGLSTLAAFSYGLPFLASLVVPKHFPLQHQQKITVASTAKCFHQAFPGEPIASRLQGLLDDPHYCEWKKT